VRGVTSLMRVVIKVKRSEVHQQPIGWCTLLCYDGSARAPPTIIPLESQKVIVGVSKKTDHLPEHIHTSPNRTLVSRAVAVWLVQPVQLAASVYPSSEDAVAACTGRSSFHAPTLSLPSVF
jgi:hypothetical protein